ncbi:MAG: hypothetical protein ACLUW6_03295 [Coriobacteriaceae bacterium]
MERVFVCHSGGEGLVAGADFDAGVDACADVLDERCDLDGRTRPCHLHLRHHLVPQGVEITHANMLFAGHYGDWQCLGPELHAYHHAAFHSNFQLAALMPVLAAGQPRRAGEVQRATWHRCASMEPRPSSSWRWPTPS